MPLLDEFIINIFCLVDDFYTAQFPKPLRRRGTPPKLSDTEVITMELVAEWLGIHQDKAIWAYFRQHWSHFFPTIPDRSQFVRQATNLWRVKQIIHQAIVRELGADRAKLHIIDGFPVEACVRTRASRSRCFKGEAWYGYCASKKKHFYGFQGHLLVDDRGIPVALQLTPANIDERDAAYDLLDGISGVLIEDKGYIRPELTRDCQSVDIELQTPLRRNMTDHRSKGFVRQILRIRRRVETTIGQLSERFAMGVCKCRDMWHLTSRMSRKMLALTLGAYINVQAGRAPMQFEAFVPA